jgi:hypothetical protein
MIDDIVNRQDFKDMDVLDIALIGAKFISNEDLDSLLDAFGIGDEQSDNS